MAATRARAGTAPVLALAQRQYLPVEAFHVSVLGEQMHRREDGGEADEQNDDLCIPGRARAEGGREEEGLQGNAQARNLPHHLLEAAAASLQSHEQLVCIVRSQRRLALTRVKRAHRNGPSTSHPSPISAPRPAAPRRVKRQRSEGGAGRRCQGESNSRAAAPPLPPELARGVTAMPAGVERFAESATTSRPYDSTRALSLRQTRLLR